MSQHWVTSCLEFSSDQYQPYFLSTFSPLVCQWLWIIIDCSCVAEKTPRSYEDRAERRALSWTIKTQFSLMERCLSESKNCGVWCTICWHMVENHDGKKSEGIREVTSVVGPWLIMNSTWTMFSREKSSISLSLHTAARVMLKYVRASCPCTQKHVENEGSHGRVWKLEKMASCERCRVQPFSLSRGSGGLFNLTITFTRGLDACSAHPLVTQEAAGKEHPRLFICFLFLLVSTVIVWANPPFLIPYSLAKQISL